MAINILAEYESVYDNDLSIYFFMRKYFAKSSYIDKSKLIFDKVDQIRLLMLYNKYNNPIRLICVEGNNYDALLNDILSTKYFYDTIYKYDTCKMLHTYLNADKSISITILCKNKFQQNVVNKCDAGFKSIVAPKASINLSSYNVLWIKYIDSLLKYKLRGNYVYLHQAMYNYEECEMSNESKVLLLHQKPLINIYQNNEFRLINPYVHLLFSPQEAL